MIKRWSKEHPVRIVAIVVSIVGLTWLLELFLAHAPKSAQWPAAIQAVSSLVLVVVTGMYVLLTARLVTAQENTLAPVQVAAQHAAAMEFNRAWSKNAETLDDAEDDLKTRLADRASWAPILADEQAAALEELSDQLLALGVPLQGSLGLMAMELGVAINGALLVLARLESFAEDERNAATNESRTFDLDHVVAAWTAETDRKSYSDWASLAAGEPFPKLAEEFERLTELVTSYLRGEAQ